ncbi:MAG: dipeptidase PepV [Firmicutes bacterium]|nr:dipeptidase PepV [Bacillota bacterium]
MEKKDYLAKIEANMEEEISFLQKLIQLNSEERPEEKGPNGEVYPFGKGVYDSLALTLEEGEKMGFVPKNVDNYGGHIDWLAPLEEGEEKPKTMGILGHLDVVPAGEGWSFEPYSGAVSDGYIYGRGTTDDKGPVVAALFAMKALKEVGYTPAKNIRVILGCDEETNWKGMDYYLEKEGTPDYGFTPDGDFPVINGEKGIANFDIVRKINDREAKGLNLRALEGGSAKNMVPEKARALLNSTEKGAYDKIKEKLEDFKATHLEINGIEPIITGKPVGKSYEVSFEGKSAHGAHPELGLNAVSLLMEFLGELNFANEEINDTVDFYNKHIGYDVYGQRIGCQLEDEKSGKLTFNVGVLSFDKKSITISVNVRYPVTKSDEDFYPNVSEIAGRYDLGIVKYPSQEPIYFDVDSPMIKTFMEIYRENTGDMENGPITIGGGTYARSMNNCVAFGALFPGDPDLMHQRDERLALDRLETMTKIYADAIYKLTQPDFEM